MKVRRITISNVAGYSSIIWDSINPNLNFLLGRNGAGKTTVLQALALGLNFIGGKRTEDLLTRTYPDGMIEIALSTPEQPFRLLFGEVRRGKRAAEFEPRLTVLHIVENRQPKNTVGESRNYLREHPTKRYMNSISELKALLKSTNEAEQQLAKDVLAICKQVTTLGTPEDWDWIETAVRSRGPKRARPLSSGQFDIAAVILDLVRLRNSLQIEPQPAFILFDNPETYLHPACQEPILDLIREMIPNAQMFISSHSLKLLSHREPKSVFWLSRENQDQSGTVLIQCVRELEEGGKNLFYELYGDDVNSAVLKLLTSLESPEYYKFLCDCALQSKDELRANPARDRQMRTIYSQLKGHAPQWTILDYGAGHGDLLVALLEFSKTDQQTTYVAISEPPYTCLQGRIEDAKLKGRISSTSRLVIDLSEAPTDCDVIVLCNVCHEILLPNLPHILAELLALKLSSRDDARLLIHEVETLPVGEANFVMWTPDDYMQILNNTDGLSVSHKRDLLPNKVPLDTTIISKNKECPNFKRLAETLLSSFFQYLPIKKEKLLTEIDSIINSGSHDIGLNEALRQRRLAFLVAQVATICLLERRPHIPTL